MERNRRARAGVFSDTFSQTSSVLKSQAELDLGLDPLESLKAFVMEVKRCINEDTWDTLDTIVDGINGPVNSNAQQALVDAINNQFPLECTSVQSAMDALDDDGSQFAFDLKDILRANCWTECVTGNGVACIVRDRVLRRMEARRRRFDHQLVRQEMANMFCDSPELKKLLVASEISFSKTNLNDQFRQFLNAVVQVNLTDDLCQIVCGAQPFVADQFYRDWRWQHDIHYLVASDTDVVAEILTLIEEMNENNIVPTERIEPQGCWDRMFNAWFIHTQRLRQ